MQSPSQQPPLTATEESSPEKFNLQLPTTAGVLRVKLKDSETEDQKNVRIGNFSPLDWLFGKRG